MIELYFFPLDELADKICIFQYDTKMVDVVNGSIVAIDTENKPYYQLKSSQTPQKDAVMFQKKDWVKVNEGGSFIECYNTLNVV